MFFLKWLLTFSHVRKSYINRRVFLYFVLIKMHAEPFFFHGGSAGLASIMHSCRASASLLLYHCCCITSAAVQCAVQNDPSFGFFPSSVRAQLERKRRKRQSRVANQLPNFSKDEEGIASEEGSAERDTLVPSGRDTDGLLDWSTV